MPNPLNFEVLQEDPGSHARLGRVETPHGTVETPVFMPVGTQASIKGLLPELVKRTESQIVLANTYHLMLRPGHELVAEMGGLHEWMRWDRPILTDSGGFQVFSLSDINKIDEDGVRFRSHIDGRSIELSPERSMQVQNGLGADIIMAFDDCPPAAQPTAAAVDRAKSHGDALGTAGRPLLSEAEYLDRVKLANERTVRWLDRCVEAHARKDDQALFPIIQGGTDLAQRDWCVERICQHDTPGYAIGGVAVGEGFEALKTVVEHTAPQLPKHKPRYLMGVGYERDILAAVRAGMDMFDCVLPTRNGRSAQAFTRTGPLKLRNARFATDPRPIAEDCDCTACSGGFSRSYLRHLFQTKEMLGPVLVSLHNIRHFQRFLLDIRHAIQHNNWSLLAERWPIAFEQGGSHAPASGNAAG